MNLLCPNCQKMLTVPEQYAGQLMKCPLCSGTFTVPGLPPSTPTAPPAPPAPPPPQPETYPLKSEPAPPPTSPFSTSATTAPTTPVSSAPAPSSTTVPPSGPVKFSVWFKPEIVQWIAPGAVILLLLFFFLFPWVGVYPGGQAAAWQYPWQVPFGSYSAEPNMQDVFHFPTTEELKTDKNLEDKVPGYDLLMVLYFLLLLLTVLVTVACAVYPLLRLKVPANIVPLLQWRWAIAAGLNLLLFLLLCVQLVWGFPIESSLYTWATKNSEEYKRLSKKETRSTPEELQVRVFEGRAAEQTTRTIYLKFVIFLHLVAIAGAGLMLALDRRGNKPAPRLDLVL